MKIVLKTIFGLVFDDWWLGVGLLVSIAITYFALSNGLDEQMSGGLFLLLNIATLILSLVMEYRKKYKIRFNLK